jgi:hypothetical protein
MIESIPEKDLQLWIKKTILQLKNRDFNSLDVESLIEELTTLGQSEKNALKSNLKILLAHLLKLKMMHLKP